MTFEVEADSYDRFMGRYSKQLAPQLADLGGVRAGQRVLDVGCGPGALTAELVHRVGDSAVSAVDPSEAFVVAAKERYPGVDVQKASAEALPFGDSSFDATFAQLVVHFMADPVVGLREMKRVTNVGGSVSVSVWDHAGDRTPLAVFWQAARELDPDVHDESGLAGAREGHLAELLAAAGLTSIEEEALKASARFTSFDDWWEPFTFGIGPAGAYLHKLDERGREELRDRCERAFPSAPFTVDTVAWAARGVA
jgi:ubiquinone/menaquinone biosynthesis C-methylase UbiE